MGAPSNAAHVHYVSARWGRSRPYRITHLGTGLDSPRSHRCNHIDVIRCWERRGGAPRPGGGKGGGGGRGKGQKHNRGAARGGGGAPPPVGGGPPGLLPSPPSRAGK